MVLALHFRLVRSWGFLEDDEFAKKMLGFSSVSFLISLVLSTTVFPVSNEEGILLPNMAAAFCYALGLGMATTFVLLLRVSSFVDPLNKNLKARSFIVEDRRDPNTRRASGSVQKSTDEIQRDKLLGEYQTGPAMARLRSLDPTHTHTASNQHMPRPAGRQACFSPN
ncbi:unnamed protein product [Effrenium voratum]|uniref:Uncharacterized protein n=1 Tax=Effrenium voratum TaxID=2562239 RepID=A0AA36N0W3_9DINO|nr:unnamed protein product [Effrenium voratum]